jgi:hypothetical protein
LISPGDVPEAPVEPRLAKEIEQQLLRKANAGLSNQASVLLRDLSILRDPARRELVEELGSHLGDVWALSRELRDRRPIDAAERDAQISLFDLYLEEPGSAGVEFHFAMLLNQATRRPGRPIEGALPRAAGDRGAGLLATVDFVDSTRPGGGRVRGRDRGGKGGC